MPEPKFIQCLEATQRMDIIDEVCAKTDVRTQVICPVCKEAYLVHNYGVGSYVTTYSGGVKQASVFLICRWCGAKIERKYKNNNLVSMEEY